MNEWDGFVRSNSNHFTTTHGAPYGVVNSRQKIKDLIYQLETESAKLLDGNYVKLAQLQIESLKVILEMEKGK